MSAFLFVVGFMAFIILFPIISIYYLFHPTKTHKESKNIIYGFKQDNDNPSITELVEFHKKNEKTKYEI